MLEVFLQREILENYYLCTKTGKCDPIRVGVNVSEPFYSSTVLPRRNKLERLLPASYFRPAYNVYIKIKVPYCMGLKSKI